MYFLVEQIMISFRTRERKRERKVLHPEEKSESSRAEKKFIYDVGDLILIWTEHENV